MSVLARVDETRLYISIDGGVTWTPWNGTGSAGGSGDGAILDGALSTIKATVLDLAAANPLTVAVTDATGAQITSFGGGTQYAEGAVAATITGTAAMWEDSGEVLRPVSAATPLPIGDAGGSLTVDAVALPLPTGASTAGNQALEVASLASLDAKLTNPLPVSVASLPLPTGAATSSNQLVEAASLASIDGKLPGSAGSLAELLQLILIEVRLLNMTMQQGLNCVDEMDAFRNEPSLMQVN